MKINLSGGVQVELVGHFQGEPVPIGVDDYMALPPPTTNEAQSELIGLAFKWSGPRPGKPSGIDAARLSEAIELFAAYNGRTVTVAMEAVSKG